MNKGLFDEVNAKANENLYYRNRDNVQGNNLSDVITSMFKLADAMGKREVLEGKVAEIPERENDPKLNAIIGMYTKDGVELGARVR